MAITVGDIYDKFPTFNPDNMIRLMGGGKTLTKMTLFHWKILLFTKGR